MHDRAVTLMLTMHFCHYQKVGMRSFEGGMGDVSFSCIKCVVVVFEAFCMNVKYMICSLAISNKASILHSKLHDHEAI